MDLLRRRLAPVVDEAWSLIDEEARRVLTLHLAGRRLADVDGPHGVRHAAVNVGDTDGPREIAPGVTGACRRVQRLTELRVPFSLEIADLDAAARGAHEPDLRPVVEAAEKMAGFEDRCVFDGCTTLEIDGLIGASPHEARKMPDDPKNFPHVIVEATKVLRDAGIGGPYAIAAGPVAFDTLAQAAEDGYPISRRVERILDGPIVRTPAISGAVVLSVRGGDYALTIGQDHSVGYTAHDRQTVELFLTETFTFRVLEPAAAVHLAEARGT